MQSDFDCDCNGDKMSLKAFLAVSLVVVTVGCDDSTIKSQQARDTETIASPNESGESGDARQRSVVKLTDAAVSKFTDFLAAEPKKHIRLSVKYEGPTGFRYDLQLDDAIRETDLIDRSNGFLLVVDPTSSLFLDGATIDWQTLPDGTAGFKFDNPNAIQP
jgi:iron-sulfur cluster insertion protein